MKIEILSDNKTHNNTNKYYFKFTAPILLKIRKRLNTYPNKFQVDPERIYDITKNIKFDQKGIILKLNSVYVTI